MQLDNCQYHLAQDSLRCRISFPHKRLLVHLAKDFITAVFKGKIEAEPVILLFHLIKKFQKAIG